MTQTLLGMMEVSHFLLWLVVIRLYICQDSMNCPPKKVNFAVCNSFLNKSDFKIE